MTRPVRHEFCREELRAVEHAKDRVIARLTEERDRLRGALEHIASWKEGETVNGSFDEPGSASIARAVLKAIAG